MAAAVTRGLARADNSVHRGGRRGIGVQVSSGPLAEAWARCQRRFKNSSTVASSTCLPSGSSTKITSS